MPDKRKVVFAEGEIYHTYNRSIGGEEIFIGKRELKRAVKLIDYYRFPQTISFSKLGTLTKENQKYYLTETRNKTPIVQICAFTLMPDHFHFLLKQIKSNGILEFMSKIQNGFAKYFNIKNDRGGTLFTRPFKAKWIGSDEILMHVSRYIHLNPVTSYIVEYDHLASYSWNSYRYYLREEQDRIVYTEHILKIVGSREKYEKFVSDQKDYQRKLNLIKRHVFD